MLEIMYELPSRKDIKKYSITPTVIEKGYSFEKRKAATKVDSKTESRRRRERKKESA